MESVAGKTAVITGAASGIGAGMAQAFAEAGMNTMIADIDADAASQVAERLRRDGTQAIAVPTDVSSWESVQQLADVTHATFGAPHVL